MTASELRRLLLAPELVVVDLAAATLVALRRAILVEHANADQPSPGDAELRRCATNVLRATANLRKEMRAYRRAAHTARFMVDDDLPF